VKELLLSYTKYNHWANSKFTGFMRKLEPSLLDKEITSSFNSIRKTIYHIWDAELIWYNRLTGNSITEWPSESFKGSNEEFFKSFLEQSGLFIDYVKNLDEKTLNGEFGYKSMEGKEYKNSRVNSIHHCMNHSTFHRGQLVTMLRQAGYTDLDSTDYITYVRGE
jgi:uncharacterized damage-inducible protein DinB